MLFVGVVRAEIFGDGLQVNGPEDSRLPLAATERANLRDTVGLIICDGRVRGTAVWLQTVGHGSTQGALVTAAHVLQTDAGAEVMECVYESGALGARQYSISLEGLVLSSSAPDSTSKSTSLLKSFSNDWAVIPLNFAAVAGNVPIHSAPVESNFLPRLESSDAHQGFLVGFDTASNRLMIDMDCSFGRLVQNSFFGSYPELFWDDCDSVPGSSGGVLFANLGESYEAVGIRVGSVFDASTYPDGPGPGARFDLQTNINLSRVIDEEVLDAIQSILPPAEVD